MLILEDIYKWRHSKYLSQNDNFFHQEINCPSTNIEVLWLDWCIESLTWSCTEQKLTSGSQQSLVEQVWLRRVLTHSRCGHYCDSSEWKASRRSARGSYDSCPSWPAELFTGKVKDLFPFKHRGASCHTSRVVVDPYLYTTPRLPRIAGDLPGLLVWMYHEQTKPPACTTRQVFLGRPRPHH